MEDISLDIIADAQSGNPQAREHVLAALSVRFTPAIRRRLSSAMDRDDAHQEAQVILLDLIDDYDPSHNVPLDAFVAGTWTHRALDTIRLRLPGAEVAVDDWDTDYPEFLAHYDTPEATYIAATAAEHDSDLLADVLDGVADHDRAALLVWASSSEWRSGERGDREYRSVGAAVAEVYAEHGLTLTPKQAAKRVNILVKSLRGRALPEAA